MVHEIHNENLYNNIPILGTGNRSGVTDTRLEAKDTKKIRCPGQGQLWTDPLKAKDKNARGHGQGPSASALQKQKNDLQKKFSGNLKKKGPHKNFSGDLQKKTFSKNFSEVPQTFNNSKK